MNNIAIIDDNVFVHQAIKSAFISSQPVHGKITSFYSLEDIFDCFYDYDTIILEPNGKCYSVMQSLDFIIKKSIFRERNNIMLLTDLSPGIAKVMFDNTAVSEVVFKDENLFEVLNKITNNHADFNKVYRSSLLLTISEIHILNDIFLGNSHYQISKKRQVSIKTISHHKRSALTKLGVNSLQELVCCLNNQ